MEPRPDPPSRHATPGSAPGGQRADAPPAGWSPDEPAAWPAGGQAGRAPGQPDEPDLRPLDRRVKPRWWLGGALALLQVLIPVLVLDLVVPHPLPNGRPTLVALAIGAVVVAVLPPIRYRRWRYALRDEDLWIRFGLLTVTVSVIPYRRLQFVDTRSGPLDRLFGLSELVVHTAALGTSGRLPGLDAAEAERLREVLSHIAPDDDAV